MALTLTIFLFINLNAQEVPHLKNKSIHPKTSKKTNLKINLTDKNENQFCDQKTINNLTSFSGEEYIDLKKTRDKSLKNFANHKLIATGADELLFKLIKAKSKGFKNWLDKRNLSEAKEEKIVYEWRYYYAENFIISKYQKIEIKKKELVDDLMNSVYKKYFNKKRKKELQSLFDEAKKRSLETVENFSIPKKSKIDISNRIKKINLYWMNEFKYSKYIDSPLELFKWGVAYDPKDNRINIGLEALQYENKETLFAVFSHEIGHAFDPCRWKAYFIDANPFEKVLQCLRTPKSVYAKKRDDSKMQDVIKNGRMSSQLALALKVNPTCNKTFYPPIGMQSDQIGESFADWFSAEVVSGSKYINKNLRADLCEKKELNLGSSYPKNQDRLFRIYFAQPKIKDKLKNLLVDSTKALYCAI